MESSFTYLVINDIIIGIGVVIMINNNYDLGSIVIMKKGHPCGTNKWEIVRIGTDIKIKCLNCGRVVMLPRIEFDIKIKKVVEK